MRENILLFFLKKEFFRVKVKRTKEESKEEIKEKTKEEKIEEFINNGISFIERKPKGINNDLFKKYFHFSTPVALIKNYLK